MKREVRRIEIRDGIHLEGIGIITAVLPMQMKNIPMKMYYDSSYPCMLLIEAKGMTHFISLSDVKGGTFNDENFGNL